MKKIRAYYKPDQETKDWPIYFHPQFNEQDYGCQWVMDIDEMFRYDFWVPFEDDEWVVQKMGEDGNWVDIF